jgi:hypothetical protein
MNISKENAVFNVLFLNYSINAYCLIVSYKVKHAVLPKDLPKIVLQ